MILTQPDHERLVALLKSHRAPTSQPHVRARLTEAVMRARVVAPWEIAPTVVTMNSIVALIDIATGEIARYALVYPADANVDRLKISVLAPLGAALLGRSEGEIVELDVPAGTKRFFVQKVAFQPESRYRTQGSASTSPSPAA